MMQEIQIQKTHNALEKKSKEELIAELAHLKKSIADLGDDQVFVKRNAKGVVRAVKQKVKLKESLNEIQTIQGKTMVTAAGAAKLNQTPGLNIITPPTVVVDGQEKSNPYIEKNERKIIQSIYVRKVVFGPNPTGNMVAIDYTLFFNIFTYFLQDLQAKIKKYPTVGYYGQYNDGAPLKRFEVAIKKWDSAKKRYKYEGFQEAETKGTNWVFFELEGKGHVPVGVWVNISHPEIQACLDSHVQRQKFGDRHAQSICLRNALLKHPAIAVQNVKANDNGVAAVSVYGWLHDLNAKDVSKMAEDLSEEKVELGKTTVIDAGGASVEINSSFSEADYEKDQVETEEANGLESTVKTDPNTKQPFPPSGETNQEKPETSKTDPPSGNGVRTKGKKGGI